MAITRFAYGAGALAGMLGGLVLFYNVIKAPNADTWIEVAEGINERCAVITTNHQEAASNTWAFTAITNIYQPDLGTMQTMMDAVPMLAPNFVESYTATSHVNYTASNLFIAAGIGPADGRLLYTVAITSGVPYYSASPVSTMCTNTLWEMYRAIRLMTTTVANVSRVSVTEKAAKVPFGDETRTPAYIWYLNWYWDTAFSGDVGVNELADIINDNHYELPASWMDIGAATNDIGETWTSYAIKTNQQIRLLLTDAPPSVGGNTTANEYGVSQSDSSNKLVGARYDGVFKVDLPSMDTGVAASVYLGWNATGTWVNVGHYQTNSTAIDETAITNLAASFSGVSNGLGCSTQFVVQAHIDDYVTAAYLETDSWLIRHYAADEYSELRYDPPYNDEFAVQEWRWKWIPETPFEFGGSVKASEPVGVVNWKLSRCR